MGGYLRTHAYRVYRMQGTRDAFTGETAKTPHVHSASTRHAVRISGTESPPTLAEIFGKPQRYWRLILEYGVPTDAVVLDQSTHRHFHGVLTRITSNSKPSPEETYAWTRDIINHHALAEAQRLYAQLGIIATDFNSPEVLYALENIRAYVAALYIIPMTIEEALRGTISVSRPTNRGIEPCKKLLRKRFYEVVKEV